eukprot:3934766-Rhodomonas_salina.1
MQFDSIISSPHSSFNPAFNMKSNCSAHHSVDFLYSAGEGDMASPFCDPGQSDEAMTPIRRRTGSDGCRTKLQSSWEEGGAPVYAPMIRSQRRCRAEYNRMVGAGLKEASEKQHLATQ